MVERGGRNVCVPLLACGDVCEKGSVFKKGKGGRDINSPQTHPATLQHTHPSPNTPTHTRKAHPHTVARVKGSFPHL